MIEQRTLPPPAASTVYELTERGQELKPVLLALGGWGLPLLDSPRAGEQFRLSWLMIALDGIYQPAGVPDPVRILLQVGDEALTIDAHGTSHQVTDGAAERPDLVVQGELPTFLAWATGQLNDQRALDAGLTATGGVRGLRRLRRMYAIGSPTPTRRSLIQRNGC